MKNVQSETEAKARYNRKHYDRIVISFTTEQGAALRQLCDSIGISINRAVVEAVNKAYPELRLSAETQFETLEFISSFD